MIQEMQQCTSKGREERDDRVANMNVELEISETLSFLSLLCTVQEFLQQLSGQESS